MKKIFFTLTMIFIVFVSTEIGLRVIFKFLKFEDATPIIHLYKGRIYSEYKLDPNGSSIRVNGYHTYPQRGIPPQFVLYDSEGFRESDRKYFQSEGIKIGVFGDSFTEDLQVSEDKTYARLLQKKLNEAGVIDENIYVFNFGFGGTGTYQQYLRYLTVKEKVKLDYVILAFLPRNDVVNNHPELGKRHELPHASYMIYENKEFEEIRNREQSYHPVSKVFLKAFNWAHYRSYLITIVLRTGAKMKQKMLAKDEIVIPQDEKTASSSIPFESYRQGGRRYTFMGSFNKPFNENWQEAWKVTEKTILMMEKSVREEKSRFLLLLLTDSLQIDHPPDMDHKYNFSYPNQRLEQFASKNSLEFINTYAAFLNKKQSLRFPFFSWEHDGHYSEVGTNFVSDILKDYFLNQLVK